MGSILAIVERAYHGTLEEQDDTILWFSAAVKNAGADIGVLLRGNAVNYALSGQDASGVVIGGVPLKVPPTIDKDVKELVGKGVPVYAVEEDLKRRGISKAGLVPGVQVIPQKETVALWQKYDSIWHW
jgi:intracellular sulfur oxidation DsrE/DsrF family protein